MSDFNNKQIAHDLAVARMAVKQLPADVLVEEYEGSYQLILDYLTERNKNKLGMKVLK